MLLKLQRLAYGLAPFCLFFGVVSLISGWSIQLGMVLILMAATLGFVGHRLKLMLFWDGARPYGLPIIHLDTAMAVRPTILGSQPTLGYRLSSLFFQTGLIDRNRVSRPGPNFQVLDPIPPVPAQSDSVPDFATLCSERARQIVGEARRQNAKINLMWSGGIDSTTACVAIMKELGTDTERLEIFETAVSRREYRHFSRKVLGRNFKRHRIKSAGDAFRGDGIVVSGEYGDQLFGSAKALDQALPRLQGPWQPGLLAMLQEQLGSEKRARAAFAFLGPAIEAAPVPINNLWTALWWLNFSMKWQAVGMRMFGATRDMSLAEYRRRTFHFFGTTDFQRWALAHAGEGLGRDLSTYKWPARDVIRAATGDEKYAATKEKEPSLRGLIKRPFKGAAVAFDTQGKLLMQPIDRSLKEPGSASGSGGDATDDAEGFGISFEYETSGSTQTRVRGAVESDFDATREQPLWDGIDGDGE